MVDNLADQKRKFLLDYKFRVLCVLIASTTEPSPEQLWSDTWILDHVLPGHGPAGRQRRSGAGHTKQARNRSPSQMCGTPAVSIPAWLGTGSAGGNRWDRSGGELGQRSDGRKGTFLLPRFRGTSLLFPPPAAERGEGRHRPAPTEPAVHKSRAGPADELAKPPTACASSIG